jgi:nucleoside-diphosphate-sugar epimerase
VVVHTAAPFFEETRIGDDAEILARVKAYRDATKFLARSAIRNEVPKIVMTGAASSVVGAHPLKDDETSHYADATQWVDQHTFDKPNEKSKLVAEKTCWNEVLAADPRSKTSLSTVLPYFVVGQPLFKESFNSSCSSILKIINNEQYGFPEVHLPIVDVEDVAAAHVACITFKGENTRHLLA